MLFLALALVAFVVVHTVISRPWLRDRLTAGLGRHGYGAFNGLVSVLGLVPVIWAYRIAPYTEIWPPDPALRAVPFVLMPFAGVFVVAGVTTPCAGLSGDRLPEGADPAPGILSVTRHPIPVALVLWACAHIAANGDAASVLLFGTFLVFAAAAPLLIDRRRLRLCGEAEWSRFAQATSIFPFARAMRSGNPVDWHGIGLRRIVAGLLAYLLLIALHQWFSGVSLVIL